MKVSLYAYPITILNKLETSKKIQYSSTNLPCAKTDI